jgi:uncharacterized protein DUF1573
VTPLIVLAALLLAPGPPAEPPPPAAPPASPAAERAPRIEVEPDHFDFGRLLPQRTVSKQFSIRNFGTADLTVERITKSCDCTAALLDNKVIKPGGSGTLRVTFETRQYNGKVARSVLIKSNDPQRPTVELKIEATVTAEAK